MRPHNPALDGIRTLACGAVVAVHIGVGPVGAGWLGVDVFFVLSGYLITGLLLDERERTAGIRLGAFYLRRLTRLYPALLVACVLALAFGRAGTGLDDAGLSLAYLSDVALARGGDFGALGTTWSLAIEEHFYLVWPVAVLLLATRRRVLVAATGLAAMSLAGFLYVNPPGVDLTAFAYNADHLRAWELLAGCVLAAAPAVRLGRRAELVAMTAAAGGLAACAVPVLWPAGRDVRQTVIAVAVAVALVVAAESDGLTRRALSLWPFPQIGAMTYGIYLFHVPVIDLVHPLPGRRAVVLAVTLAVLLAVSWASYKFVETPAREWGRRAARSHGGAGRVLPVRPVGPDRLAESSVEDLRAGT